jgi:hypothetical protein
MIGMNISHPNKTEIMRNLSKIEELKDAMHQKNEIIHSQNRRIRLLEDKLDEIRHKYISLKYFRFGNIAK